MQANIKCPNCQHEFELSDTIKAGVEKDLRAKMIEWQANREKELQAQASQKLGELVEKANEDSMKRLKLLEEEAKEKEDKLRLAAKKELALMQEKDKLEEQGKNAEIEMERRIREQRKDIEAATIKRQEELFELRNKDAQDQLAKIAEEKEFLKKQHQIQSEAQQKLIEELRRKAEQGSMQLQGESQEILLEELLQEQFPYDSIEPIGKGVRGADCVQIVKNNLGHSCGSIMYESKKTKTWSNEWVEKLKTDMRSNGADIAILVTQVFPKDMTRFGEKDGIWICNFNEVVGVAGIIRNGILKVYQAQKNQENKGDKMHMLYEYLTGNEFRGQLESIIEGFMSIKNGINKERIQMEKIWKEREKQLEKVLLNTSGMYGSVKGIAGASVGNIALLDGGDDVDEIDE